MGERLPDFHPAVAAVTGDALLVAVEAPLAAHEALHAGLVAGGPGRPGGAGRRPLSTRGGRRVPVLPALTAN